MKENLFLSSLACLLFLVACTGADQDADPDVVKGPPPICPQVAIIRDLQNISDYGTEIPDLSQLVGQARMKSIEGDCAYLPQGIDVKFSINFIAGRGPRLGGLHTAFPYFIALVDPSDKVLTKNRVTKDFAFSSNSKIAEDSEDLHVFIPLPKEQKSLGPSYRVLVGFQLTKEQLGFARGDVGTADTQK